MKRTGHIYEKIYTRENILLAFKKASQGKTKRNYVIKVAENLDFYVNEIQAMLKNEAYVFTKPKEKVIYDHSCGKERLIKVPRFYPDQIIHWCVMLQLEPIIRKGMYRYCCGSVKGRGGFDAKKYIERAVKDAKAKYVAKLDISKFFNSVDTDVVMAMLERKIKDKKMLKIVRDILMIGGDGLPIGFYTSQGLSNFVLEKLDHIVKENYNIKWYCRYVDDMVLLDANKRKLHKYVFSIADYLRTIKLNLKSRREVWKLDGRPIDFVGYRFYRNKTLLRKKIYFRLLRRVRNVRKSQFITYRQATGIISLVGWIKHLNARNLYTKRIRPYAPIQRLKTIVSKHDKGVKNGIQKRKMVRAN